MTHASHTSIRRSPELALADTLDGHGAAVCAYAETVAPEAAGDVAWEAVEAARSELPSARQLAGSPAVARVALYRHLRLAAAEAVAPESDDGCLWVPFAIARLANGDLSADEEAELRAHVSRCPECRHLAERFTAGERLLGAAATGGPVPLRLYEAAGRGAANGRRATAAVAASGLATARRRPLLAGLAALVAIFGIALATANALRSSEAGRGALPDATPASTRAAAAPTPTAMAGDELTASQRAARAAAARDRRVNLAREQRALTRERRAARRAAAARRRRVAAPVALPDPVPTPTAVPTATPVPAPAAVAPAPSVPRVVLEPAPPPPPPPPPPATPTPTPAPGPRTNPAPDPPGRVAPDR